MLKQKFFLQVFFTFLFTIITLNSWGQLENITKELKRLSSVKDSIKMVDCMTNIGMLYQAKNVDSCFYFGMKAKSLASKINYQKGETDADNVIAVAFNIRGLYQKSLQLFSNVLSRYREQSDTVNVIQALMNIAIVYKERADPEKSKKYFQQAINIGKNIKQDSILSLLYVNYCIANQKLTTDSIDYYLNKSQKISERYTSYWIPILITQVKAITILQRGGEDPLPLLEKALNDSKKLNFELLEINSLFLFGNYYSKDPKRSLAYIQRADDLIIKTGYKNLLLESAYTILELTKLTGNTLAIEKAHERLENLYKEENRNLKNFIGDYVKYNALQDDVKILSYSNQNKQNKIWYLVIISTVSIILAIFILWQYNVSRKLNQKISEQNKNLQNTLFALEQSQDENTKMMKIVAHDLRNPLSAITAIATLLLDKDYYNPDDKTMINLVKNAGENSLELTKNLLLINTKEKELKKEAIEIYKLLENCVDVLNFKAIEKNQLIKLQSGQRFLNLNREKIWRIMSNLIANAIKFSPNNTEIKLSVEENQNEIIIAVKDNGIGIPENMHGTIFQMFNEFKRSGTAGEQSFGLGLAICKQIVEAHKGRIWFESGLGKGTIFYVALPL